MASSSSSSSSSPTATIVTDDLPPPPPLLPTEPIEYVKISCGEGEARHTFIVNRAALVKYSNVCSDLLGIGDEADSVQSSFSLIGAASRGGAMKELEFTTIPARTMKTTLEHILWKFRYANVDLELIPEFPLPPKTDKLANMHLLVSANELRC